MPEREPAIEFQDATQTLSQSLRTIAAAIHAQGERVSIRGLLTAGGEHSLLLLLILVAIPFMLPLSIPGSSTVIGMLGIILSIGVMLNRVPWMPGRVLDWTVESRYMVPALERGAGIVERVDRVSHRRLGWLSETAAANRANGAALLVANVLLLFPMGFVPFANWLPASSILLMAAGMSQRDGLLILAGWLILLGSLVYFSALAVAAILAGQGLMDQFMPEWVVD